MTEGDARTTRGIIGAADARSTAGIIFVFRKISVIFGDKLSTISKTAVRKIVGMNERSVRSSTKDRKIGLC